MSYLDCNIKYVLVFVNDSSEDPFNSIAKNCYKIIE